MHRKGLQPAIPSPALLALQSQWLSAAQSRLLRRADIARRRVVVDLGAGACAVSPELARRSGGKVLAIDASLHALNHASENATAANLQRICADAEELPLADSSVDLVFVQCGFLWFANPERAIAEIVRVLRGGGALAAIEPDYGGMIEHPSEIAVQEIWIAALSRSGADPFIGRKLPALLAAAGLAVDVQLLDRLQAPQPERFDLLEELPLSTAEANQLRSVRERSQHISSVVIAHLPLFLTLGAKHT